MRRLHVTLGGFLCILTLLGLTLAVQEERALRVITIVNISDWHGQLEPVTVTIDGHEQQVGGAAVLKSYFGVDVLLGDHTDVSVNAMINDMIVTENRSKGTQYTVIDLTYDLRRQAIVSRTVVQKRPWVEGRSPDPSVQALIDQYQARLQPLFDRPVGETATVLSGSRQAESLLGNLVTDILRQRYQVQLAFDVSGAMRADLPSSYQPADRQLRRKDTGYAAGPPYDVVVGDFYSIFPFGNEAVTFTISGKTLLEVLEHSVSQGSIEEGQFVNTAGRFLQVSGFHYRFDPRQAVGQRVVALTWPDGTAIPRGDTQYTAVTSAFVYYGGDGYTMLSNGSGTTRELLADTIHRAVHQMGKVTTAIEGRLSSVQAWSP